MRAYDAASEDALQARNRLKDWAGEGFLSKAQYSAMEPETVCDLRRTNVVLRLVLFLFSMIVIAAGVGFFFAVFVSHSSERTMGGLLLVFGPLCYAAAEGAVSRAKLYRYGIEEALLVCSVGFVCVGMEFAFFGGSFSSSQHAGEFVVPAFGAVACLWIWHRFGLAYWFLGTMLFAVWVTSDWTSSHAAQHLIAAMFFALGLVAAILLSSRRRFTHLEEENSIAEALLWLGLYVAINVQISSISLLVHGWDNFQASQEFPKTFYWTTWVLTWCLPPVTITRGVRAKDRYVMAVGAISAVLTLVTNKSYLGWPRHTWDPMLLGILLSGTALWIRRWLSRGPDGIRGGFTAQRLSGRDKHWMSIASTAFGLAAQQPAAKPDPGFHFGGGDSGGAGASSDF